jgi:hypothetical protein
VSSIAPYAAGFGAVTAFFSMLTGQLPTGAGWLMALTLAVARDRNKHATDAGWMAITAVVAFGFGAAATVVTKQVLAFTLVEPETWRHFLGQLDRYSAIPVAAWGVPGVLVPFAQLARRIDVLTSGSEVVGYALIACVSLIWFAAAVRGWDRRQSACGRDMLILVGAALIPVVWVMLLPQHSYIHATFMVRMFVVPIAIAPLALCWPFMARDSDTDAVEA